LSQVDGEVKFSQWVSTDRSHLLNQSLPVAEFIDSLIEKLEKLLPHSFIAKKQAEYYRERKDNLCDGEMLVLMDFAENYSFILQDEAQGYHWTNDACTLHPVVLYYSQDGHTVFKSMCFVSDDLIHDVSFVYEIQRRVVDFVKGQNLTIKSIEYFTDGCAAQYKNCKSFLNLCEHENDFGIKAKWSFFATSHGKSACDGIGGSVKRTVTKYNLQHHDPQIADPKALFEFCSTIPSAIHFIYITSTELTLVRETFRERFAMAKTVKGTRSFHYFAPFSDEKILAKTISFDDASKTFRITK